MIFFQQPAHPGAVGGGEAPFPVHRSLSGHARPARLPRLLHGRERLPAPPVPPTAWAGLCPHPGLSCHFQEGKTFPGRAVKRPREPSVPFPAPRRLRALFGEVVPRSVPGRAFSPEGGGLWRPWRSLPTFTWLFLSDLDPRILSQP